MRPKSITDDELISVARAVFVEHGASASTNTIAQKAGVSQATLFKRFGSKVQLMQRALGIEALEPVIRRLENGPTQADLKAQLVDLANEFIAGFGLIMPHLITLRGAGIGPGVPCDEGQGTTSESRPARARVALKAWLRRAQREGRLGDFDAEVASTTLLAAFKAPSVRTHLFEESVHADRFAERLIDGIWKGIKP
ncbi:MAG: TetR/AcrR family transcriptional regulator [Myxococcota bacterium]|nr:TetR/AcrR family transcriptional regulator [Myxococcota bacterium]